MKLLALNEWQQFLVRLVILMVGIYLLTHFVVQLNMVSGSSMSPTLQDQNVLILDKISHLWAPYERYDIIVFHHKTKKANNYIKRIIGLPGETIDIKDGQVYVNDELLSSDLDLNAITDMGDQEFPITVGDNEYFVLGDNRNHSEDSRYTSVGLVSSKDILGKVVLRIWPFSEFGQPE